MHTQWFYTLRPLLSCYSFLCSMKNSWKPCEFEFSVDDMKRFSGWIRFQCIRGWINSFVTGYVYSCDLPLMMPNVYICNVMKLLYKMACNSYSLPPKRYGAMKTPTSTCSNGYAIYDTPFWQTTFRYKETCNMTLIFSSSSWQAPAKSGVLCGMN